MGWPGAALLRGKSLAKRRAANAGCIAARTEGRACLMSREAIMIELSSLGGCLCDAEDYTPVRIDKACLPCSCSCRSVELSDEN